MLYDQTYSVSGDWVKAAELKSGSRAAILSETQRVPSQFKDEKTGAMKMQDLAKVKFEGVGERNVALNRATINALVAAFGRESADWIGKVLTVHTEKMLVGGKRVTGLFLVPDGYEVGDDNGYMVIVPKGMPARVTADSDIPVIEEDEDAPKPIRDVDLPF